MSTVSIEEAQVKLLDLIHTLQPNEEVIITENNQPVARLTPLGERALRVPGPRGRETGHPHAGQRGARRPAGAPGGPGPRTSRGSEDAVSIP